MMKNCNKCGELKPLSEFSRRSTAKDGRQSTCKPCATAIAVAWQKANPARRAIVCSRWTKRNPEKTNAKSAAWAKANAWYFAEYKSKNRGKLAAKYALRRSRKLQATPKWGNAFFVEEAYNLAALRTRIFGFPWHVDHIVPLQSKFVCGLHCEANLRVIPAKQNMSKGNRTWPDMPIAVT